MPSITMQLEGQPVTMQVPEGMDPRAYAEQVGARHAEQEQYSAASDSGVENFQAGIGRGLSNVGRNAVNMLPYGDNIDGFSDEDLAGKKELDSDLLDTGAGQAGNFVGELAATAPLGGIGTLGAKGAAAVGAKGLAKAAGSTAGRVITEGAATGALLADPGERLGGAATAGAFSAGAGGVGKVLKKVMTKPWVSKTAAATDLEGMTGKSIPLSQSAEPGVVKQIYEGIVANMPGSSQKLRGQYDHALQDFREYIVEEASPPGVDRVIGLGDNMQDAMGKLREKWDDVYNFSFKEAPVVLFDDVFTPPKIWNKLKPKGAPDLKPGQQVTGQHLLTLKDDLQNVINDIPRTDHRMSDQLIKFKNSINGVLKENFNPSGKGKGGWADEFKRFEELTPSYTKYLDLKSAAKKAENLASEFTPKQLLKATSARAGKEGLEGGGALNKEAAAAVKALEPFSSKAGIFQTTAALGLASGIMGTIAGTGIGAATAAVPIAISRGLASPKVQRAIAGELPGQHAMAAALRKGKDAIYQGVHAGNRSAVIAGSE